MAPFSEFNFVMGVSRSGWSMNYTLPAAGKSDLAAILEEQHLIQGFIFPAGILLKLQTQPHGSYYSGGYSFTGYISSLY